MDHAAVPAGDVKILYWDAKLCVAVKPAGVLSTDEPGGMPDLVRAALGGCARTVHRLDRVVGGLMVLARTRAAAATLSGQIRDGSFGKSYLAVVHGSPPSPSGTFTDLLLRSRAERRTSVVPAPEPGAQEAALDYETLARVGGRSLVAVRLHTGRTHQIRVQFSSRGLPLVGDRKYGLPGDDCPIALWSWRLSFAHPATGAPMAFQLPPPEAEPWLPFAGAVPGAILPTNPAK